jgi:hypothetical protein
MGLLSYGSVAALQAISMHDSIFPCFDILALLMNNMASGICGFGGIRDRFDPIFPPLTSFLVSRVIEEIKERATLVCPYY